MQPSVQTAAWTDGRIAGALYLVSLPLGCVRAVYVQGTLLAGSFAADHAAATAERIVTNEMTFRLAMLADIATGLLLGFVVLALYRPLSQVSSRAYLVLGGLLVTALYCANALIDFAGLLFARDEGALSAISQVERDGFLWFFLRIHFQIKEITRILWGLMWLIPLGVLAYRSRILPRVLGVLLIVDGVACVANSAAWFLLPAAAANRIFFVIWPVFLPEVFLMFWLLIRGVRLVSVLRPEQGDAALRQTAPS
jgi:hypothetical protein